MRSSLTIFGLITVLLSSFAFADTKNAIPATEDQKKEYFSYFDDVTFNGKNISLVGTTYDGDICELLIQKGNSGKHDWVKAKITLNRRTLSGDLNQVNNKFADHFSNYSRTLSGADVDTSISWVGMDGAIETLRYNLRNNLFISAITTMVGGPAGASPEPDCHYFVLTLHDDASLVLHRGYE